MVGTERRERRKGEKEERRLRQVQSIKYELQLRQKNVLLRDGESVYTHMHTHTHADCVYSICDHCPYVWPLILISNTRQFCL